MSQRRKVTHFAGCEIKKMRPTFKTEMLIYHSKAYLNEQIFLSKITYQSILISILHISTDNIGISNLLMRWTKMTHYPFRMFWLLGTVPLLPLTYFVKKTLTGLQQTPSIYKNYLITVLLYCTFHTECTKKRIQIWLILATGIDPESSRNNFQNISR